ncbi:MAG: MiaB/RimO family radical SAM methylthiotransferase [Candidatus Omnitrophota bacterium]
MRENSIGILSLGCPRNLVDSEQLLSRLKEKGYYIVDVAKADVAIVNTCAFIKDAKTESIDVLLDLIKLKEEGRLKKIIVYGCLVQRYKDYLKKELPQIDAFIGTPSFPAKAVLGVSLTGKHYAYLKICEGCINKCSFCIISKIKGKFTSEDMESLLEKVRAFDKNDIQELNIIGQDITAYGIDLYGGRKLPELAQKILKKSKSIKWLRFLYLYPDFKLVDELLTLMKDEPRICKYIDLPIQHINDRILKLMNRQSTKSDIMKIVDRIRKRAPEAAIRTTLIVGFPSESDKEFKELFNFIESVKFERLGVFTYSREEDTPAYDFKKQIPEKTKQLRLNQIMLRQQELAAEFNRSMRQKVIDVLIDEPIKDNYLGRSQYDAPEVDGVVYVSSKKKLKPGDMVKVKITDTLEYDLIGKKYP